jgi:hypothetical protein
MSLTSLGYDACNYRQTLRETMGPGMYFLGTPLPLRDACDGPEGRRTDAGSELLGLPRRESRCSVDKYGGSGSGGLHCEPPAPLAVRDRHVASEGTRVSNPPSTLRGNGVNRWTPLCEQPQDHAIEPFSHVPYNDKRGAKDRHAPCDISPLDAGGILPPPGSSHAPRLEPLEAFPPVPMLPDYNACEARRDMIVRA